MTEVKADATVGDDLLKKIIKEGIDVYKIIKAKLADGFQWTDMIPIVWEVKDMSFLVTDWKDVVVQFDNMTPEKFDDLVKELLTDIGGTPDEVATLINESAGFLEAAYGMYIAIKNIADKKS